MKRKSKKRLWVRMSMVLIAVVAGLGGYFLGFEQSHRENEKSLSEKERESAHQAQEQVQKSDQAPIFAAEIKQPKSMAPQ